MVTNGPTGPALDPPLVERFFRELCHSVYARKRFGQRPKLRFFRRICGFRNDSDIVPIRRHRRETFRNVDETYARVVDDSKRAIALDVALGNRSRFDRCARRARCAPLSFRAERSASRPTRAGSPRPRRLPRERGSLPETPHPPRNGRRRAHLPGPDSRARARPTAPERPKFPPKARARRDLGPGAP